MISPLLFINREYRALGVALKITDAVTGGIVGVRQTRCGFHDGVDLV